MGCTTCLRLKLDTTLRVPTEAHCIKVRHIGCSLLVYTCLITHRIIAINLPLQPTHSVPTQPTQAGASTAAPASSTSRRQKRTSDGHLQPPAAKRPAPARARVPRLEHPPATTLTRASSTHVITGVGPADSPPQDLPEGRRSYRSLIRQPLQTRTTAALDVWYFVRALTNETELALGPEDGDQRFTTRPPKEKLFLGCRLW